MVQPPPLTGIRVLEFAGLAPGPYAGLLLADYGAEVIRIDRAHPLAHSVNPPPASADRLTRHKASVAVNTKSPAGVALVKALIPQVDVLIDPFRPGVLEKMGLGPQEVLLRLNPRLIVARVTGFRRDGAYAAMAGHDINYLAVAGVLSLLGRAGQAPHAPGNLLGDFAGGGAVCVLGILLALLQRSQPGGRGQVVEANMVDGAAHLASFVRFNLKTDMWAAPRGENVLDGGCPFYDTYVTRDGRYMAVGALEPQFYAALLRGLGLPPDKWAETRHDRTTWPAQRRTFARIFQEKTREEWEGVFAGTDACCTPVFTHAELEHAGYEQRPIVTLTATPGYAIASSDEANRTPAQGQGRGTEGAGWESAGLPAGIGGEEVLGRWLGWTRGRQFEVKDGGLELIGKTERSRL